MSYDNSNIFAKILRGEIPCERIYEDAYVLAFNDINPKAPVHVLVVPKSAYVSFIDFVSHSSSSDIAHFFKTVSKIAADLGLADSGFRLVANTGKESGQEVPHFHVHIIGAKKLVSMG